MLDLLLIKLITFRVVNTVYKFSKSLFKQVKLLEKQSAYIIICHFFSKIEKVYQKNNLFQMKVTNK